MQDNWRSLRVSVPFTAILILPIFLMVLLYMAFGDALFVHWQIFGALIFAFFFGLIASIMLVMRVFIEFAQRFYNLSQEQASNLVSRLIFGEAGTYYLPMLDIQNGRVDLDGPEILFKVGGPGLLRIAHDTAVVTQRLGRLERVLGPGVHRLHAFEKVWDVVDLRPQHREIKVEFMTRDGIPVFCTADIRFRVDAEGMEATEETPFPYQEEMVLAVTTSKRVRNVHGKSSPQDWQAQIADGVLNNVTRNTLERYSLDDFLNPQQPHPNKRMSNSEFIKSLEIEIEQNVRERGYTLGIAIDKVQLGPVMPAEGAISQQWLEFWSAKLQRIVDERTLEGDAVYTDLSLKAKVNAKIEFLTTILDEVKSLTHEGEKVSPDLLALSFIDVLRTMTEQGDPKVQKQLETLIRLIREFM